MSLKKLTPALKKKITADWHALFPQMGVYELMGLARRIGPLVQGIALDRDSGNMTYFPTTYLHNLCRPCECMTLSFGQRLLTKRSGTQERIAASFHEQYYRDAAERLAEASLLPLDGDLKLDQVLEAYRGYQELHEPDSKYPVSLFEDAVLLCAWCGQMDRAMAVLRSYVEEMHDWPGRIMERDGGVEAWERKVLEMARDPETVRAVAESEALKLRVNHLPTVELIC